jgi:hypothetical protein
VPRNNSSGNQEYYSYDKVPGLNATAIRRNQNSNSEEETNRDEDYSGEHTCLGAYAPLRLFALSP